MELKLIRKWFRETYTIGKLYSGDEFVCETLEDKVRILNDKNGDGDFDDPGEGKIYGKTAIPEGRYKVVFSFWKKHNRQALALLDVPGYTGIRIHAGTNEEDTLGCILVGENKIKGGLIYSKYQLNRVENIVRFGLKDNGEVWLTIENETNI